MKGFWIAVLGMVLAAGAPATAKMKKSGFGDMNQHLVVTPMGGLVFPTGDFSNVANMGFSTGAGLEYFVAPRVALAANFGYQRFGKDSLVGDNPNFFFIGGGVRGFLVDDAKFNPYGRVAGGLYQGNSKSNAGVNFGVGGLCRANAKVGIFAEGSIHFVFVGGGGASTTLTFFGLSGGLSLTIPTGK